MQIPTHLLRTACAILAVGTVLGAAACTGNPGPNSPANATYSTGQHVPKPPSAGVGPQNAGPAGSQ